MRVEELAPEFGVQLEEELAGLYSPAQIQAMRLAHERKFLALLRKAYGPEISDIEALRELWQHLIDIEEELRRQQSHT
jgi:hypothetical protein